MRTVELLLNSPGERLDRALKSAFPDLSRSQWQRLISEGQVMIDGEIVKRSQRLVGGETAVVNLPDPRPTQLQPEPIPLDIRYEDDDMLVLNKPAGMVVHPGTGHESGTIVHAVLHYCPNLPGIGGEIRPGIVHRLDKATSGLLIVAKNERALGLLQAQFKARTVEKVYLALVNGTIQPPQAIIDAPIGRNPEIRQKMMVVPRNSRLKARSAVTRYETIRQYDKYTLVRCFPKSGRTHQIRVHLAYIGYPVVGDRLYGMRKQRLLVDRHFLHACQLTFQRPSDGRAMTIEAELPQELQHTIANLTAAGF